MINDKLQIDVVDIKDENAEAQMGMADDNPFAL
jgi:hypothetical protein